MVDDFQKKYDTLQIPYPKDTLSSSIESAGVQEKATFEKFCAQSKTRITGITTEMAKWEAMMPVEEMNLEEALDAVPHLVVNPNKPSFWPHDEDYDEWRKEFDKETDEETH
jgi:F-type H+-transporting ATPase subunit d